jgi:hypothetical protein
MQYEVKDDGTNWMEAPRLKKDDPTKVQVRVSVNTTIVGDIYGFFKQDMIIAEFGINMTGEQMKTNTLVQARAFSADKYPNT